MDQDERPHCPLPQLVSPAAEAAGLRLRRRWVLALAIALLMLVGVACFAAWRWRRDRGETSAPPGLAGPAVYRSSGDGARQVQIEAMKAEAIAVARELVDAYPQSPDALCVLGLVHNRYGNRKEAVRCWQESLAIAPDYAPASHSMGLDAFQAGEYEEAVRWLRQTLKQAPNEPDALLLLGKSLANLGRAEEAIEAFKRHLHLSPASLEGWFRLGQAHMELKQYEQARQCYLAALRLDADCKPVYYSLAQACDGLGRKGEAEMYRREFSRRYAREQSPPEGRRHRYDDLAAIRESLANAHRTVAGVYAAHGDKAKAEAHWGKAVEACPERSEARLELVSFYQGEGRLEDALRMLDELRTREPNNVLYHLQAGALCVQLKRLDAAEEAFGKVAELAPERPEGYVALAQLYVLGDRDRSRAKEAAQTAVRLAPTAANYFLLGTICDRLGDMPGALTAMKRAAELDPGNPQYAEAYASIQARRATQDQEPASGKPESENNEKL